MFVRLKNRAQQAAFAHRHYRHRDLSWKKGIPSHDTLARVFARIDPQAFEQCCQNWLASITATMGTQVIPIDAKTLRGYYDREGQTGCALCRERMGE